MSDLTYLTKEGYENLRSELIEMKTKERNKVAAAIAEAREKGDLSENAEYDAAKEAQSLLEFKILQLEDVLAKSRILDDHAIDNSKVYILSKVKVLNKKTNQTVTYTLVSAKEADLKSNRISVESPIGKGLLGKTVGEVVKITVPAGVLEFEVLDISR
jgi:transcription elongation factor GreA